MDRPRRAGQAAWPARPRAWSDRCLCDVPGAISTARRPRYGLLLHKPQAVIPGIEQQLFAGEQFDKAVFQLADADFRALQIG